MHRTKLLWLSLLAFGLAAAVGAGIAHASPASVVAGEALGIRDHVNGQFESATGIPVYLGTIDATGTSKTNAQATTPFNSTGDYLCGKMLLIQNAGAVDIRVHPVTTSTGVVSNTRTTGFGPAISAGERVTVFMPASGRCFLAGIATSSTANIDVWELQ